MLQRVNFIFRERTQNNQNNSVKSVGKCLRVFCTGIFSPTVGSNFRQSSEKYFANHRKTIVKFIFLVYNKDSMNGNEVFRMKNYRKRIADDILRRKLEGKGAVLIEGPK